MAGGKVGKQQGKQGGSGDGSGGWVGEEWQWWLAGVMWQLGGMAPVPVPRGWGQWVPRTGQQEHKVWPSWGSGSTWLHHVELTCSSQVLYLSHMALWEALCDGASGPALFTAMNRPWGMVESPMFWSQASSTCLPAAPAKPHVVHRQLHCVGLPPVARDSGM